MFRYFELKGICMHIYTRAHIKEEGKCFSFPFRVKEKENQRIEDQNENQKNLRQYDWYFPSI